MNKLLDEEAEEDEAFWNQEALKDVSKLLFSLNDFLLCPYFFCFLRFMVLLVS